MKVTSVEPQQKHPGRFNIFLDGKFAFGADEDLVVNFRLMKDKEINQEDLNKIMVEAEVGKLADRIYGLLTRRDRSEKEIRDYLKTLSFKRKVKGYDEISDFVIDATIERLKRKNLIDDLNFASNWVESRRRSKKLSNKALGAELYKKGVPREIADQVLSENSPENELVLAQEAISKKVKSFKNLDEQTFKRRVYGFLGRRGFSFDVISQVIESLHKNE